MAKQISDEKIKLSIIVDGNPAQQELLKLEKSTAELNARQRELREEKRKLISQGKKESEQYKELTAEIKKNSEEISNNKKRMSELQKEIGITGLTMAQLRQKATALRAALQNSIPGGEAFRQYSAELEQVTERLNELRGSGEEAGGIISQLADRFNRYAGLTASVIAVLTGMVLSIQKIIDFNGKLADAQSNVQKTTGMTKDEVDELTKSFGLLHTRTSRINLLGIAETGGRLGIAKDEILDFVKVMDKASVALGDSFEGGPEVVAEKLGKIKSLFKETKDVGVEIAFEAIGSSMNDLGAAGTASEENIAEFMTRIGAMPEAFKPGIDEALGMGAAFEESGIKAEVAASNYSKVIGIASNSIGAFAQVMKRPKAELEKLINTNPNEFFLQFAQSLKGLDATQLAQVLDYLKLNDNEVKMVLGAASQNVDLFREKIVLAGKSLGDASSLTNEFNIKNNNLAAILDKLKKKIIGSFSSETIVNFLAKATNAFAELIGVTEDTDNSMKVWRNTLIFIAKMIAIVSAGLISNAAAHKLVALWTARNTEATLLYNIQQRANAIWTGIQTVASYALAAAKAVLTGNITRARIAFMLMASTMKTTPWGLIIGMIGAAVTAYAVFSERAEKLSKVQKVLADVNLEATKSIAKEKAELELLSKVARDETKSKELRQKAIEKLNQIIPDYIGNLSLENIRTMEGTNILKKYTEELYKNARAKAAAAKFEELAKQRLEVENTTAKDYRSGSDKVFDAIFGSMGVKSEYAKDRSDIEIMARKVLGLQKENIKRHIDKETGEITGYSNAKYAKLVESLMNQTGLAEKEQKLRDIDLQMKALEGGVVDSAIIDTDNKYPTADPNAIPDKKGKKSKKDKYDDSYLKEEQKAADELYQIWKKNQEDRIALMQDGYEKELAVENLKTADILRENYKRQEALIALEKQIQNDIESAEKTGDSKKVASLKRQKETVIKEKEELNKQIEYKESLHQLKVATIQEKAGREEIEKIKQQHDAEKASREAAFLEELERLDLSNAAKAKRKEDFSKEEAKREIEFLKKHLADYEKMIADIDFNGIDFSLLSPEQEEKLKQDIEKIRLAIAKLNEAQGKEQSPEEIDLGIRPTDILGFSQDQWDKFFQNISNGTVGFQTMSMAIAAAGQIFGQFDQLLTASENAQLRKYEKNSDTKKRKLKQELDAGYINQSQYKKGIETIDKDLDKKKAEIEYKQAKRQKAIAIANTIMNTAQAIIGIWAQFPKFDFGATAAIMSGVVGALGAIQLATILKTPLPAKGFEHGLYSNEVRREQDGKIFKAQYGGKTRSGMVTKPTYFLTGENGPEMIIDSKAYSQLSPGLRDSLLREIRGIKGFENGYYNQGILNTGVPSEAINPSYNNDKELMIMVLNVVAENTATMKELRDSGVIATVSNRDMKSMKYLKEGIERFTELRNKSKQ